MGGDVVVMCLFALQLLNIAYDACVCQHVFGYVFHSVMGFFCTGFFCTLKAGDLKKERKNKYENLHVAFSSIQNPGDWTFFPRWRFSKGQFMLLR